MKLAVTFTLALAAAASTARADITSLGGYSLGQKLTKYKAKKITLYGCAGTIEPRIEKKKVTRVLFEVAPGCAAAGAIADALTKELGSAPVANAEGDKLWEGTTGSVILTKVLGGGGDQPEVLVVPPTTKRVCWPDDGFAAFWTGFQKAAASGKPAAMAPSFAFPFSDDDKYLEFKDAKAFAKTSTKLIGDDDAKAIATGEKKPTCSVDEASYSIFLDGSNYDLAATRTGSTWQWTSMSLVSPD